MSSDLTVKLIRSSASDDAVIQAAQVSIKGENDPETIPERLINKLMLLKHGVPFEHTFFTFFVETTLFTAEQWKKHRIGSINELSGRYGKSLPKFYFPPETRPLVNEGTKMDPDMKLGTFLQYQTMRNTELEIATKAWEIYEMRIKLGISEEIARSVLPRSAYTQFYWSINARSLMLFLSKRVDSPDNLTPTHPQWEIEQGAKQVEEFFKLTMPLSHAAFVKAGRVAP